MIWFLLGILVGAVGIVVTSCCYVSGRESRREEQAMEEQAMSDLLSEINNNLAKEADKER